MKIKYVTKKQYARDMALLKRYVEGLRRRNINMTKIMTQKVYNEKSYLKRVLPMRERQRVERLKRYHRISFPRVIPTEKIPIDKAAGTMAE